MLLVDCDVQFKAITCNQWLWIFSTPCWLIFKQQELRFHFFDSDTVFINIMLDFKLLEASLVYVQSE